MWIHCTHLDKRRQLIYFLRLNYAPSQTSTEVDLSDCGLLALYSEIHPTISYIVHYDVNMIAPVYKLQVRTQHCGVTIQGQWNRSGWSGFGQTTFLDEKLDGY